MTKGSARLRKLRTDAQTLEARGQLRDAIDAWTALNRRQPDSEIEQHLVALRHDAVRTLDESAPVLPWPRELADPFPEIHGRPPEVGVGELDSELLGGAIRHHGCLLIRGLMPAAAAAELVEVVDAAFDAREAFIGGTPRSETAPWYAPDAAFDAVGSRAVMVRNMNRELLALQAADSPRALFQVIDALDRASIPKILDDHFGETALLTVDKCTLRRVKPMPRPGWHQDGSFMGSVRSVDVWIALTRCGGDTGAPGLEILPRRMDRVLECGGDGARNTMEVVPEDVERNHADVTPVRPTFEPGDALLFDELFLHRTMPGGDHDRYALEAWFFAASGHPKTYVPLVP